MLFLCVRCWKMFAIGFYMVIFIMMIEDMLDKGRNDTPHQSQLVLVIYQTLSAASNGICDGNRAHGAAPRHMRFDYTYRRRLEHILFEERRTKNTAQSSIV